MGFTKREWVAEWGEVSMESLVGATGRSPLLN